MRYHWGVGRSERQVPGRATIARWQVEAVLRRPGHCADWPARSPQAPVVPSRAAGCETPNLETGATHQSVRYHANMAPVAGWHRLRAGLFLAARGTRARGRVVRGLAIL